MSLMRLLLYVVGLVFLTGLSAVAGIVDNPGTIKRWGPYQLTFLSADSSGSLVKIEVLLQNKSKEERHFSYQDAVRVLSDEGDMGDLQYSTRCSAAMPPEGKLRCKLNVQFEQAPSGVTVQFLEDGLEALVNNRKRWPMAWFTATIVRK